MEFGSVIAILWRRKWTILATTLLTVAVVGIGTWLATPVYEASSTLRVAASAAGFQNTTAYSYNSDLMNTYVELATSAPVVQELTKQLNLRRPPQILAEVVPNTELVRITVADADPKLASAAANTLAQFLIAQSADLYSGGAGMPQDTLSTQVAAAQADLEQTQRQYESLIVQTPAPPGQIDVSRLSLQAKQSAYNTLLSQYQQATLRQAIQSSMTTIVEVAAVPVVPSQPRVALNYALGLLGGLLVGLALAFVFENLDSTLHSAQEIVETTGMKLLAKIPRIGGKQLSTSGNGSSPLQEVFRTLAARMPSITDENKGQVLLFLSGEPGSGVSTIVSNLAFCLADLGHTVAAIDCNLRLPTLDSRFHVTNERGLTDVLERKLGLDKALQKAPDGAAQVLTSGPLPTDPAPLLRSPQMAKTIDSASHEFDYVLLDAPALLAVADAAELARLADGLILVVELGRAKQAPTMEAGKFVAGFHDKFTGLVVTKSEADQTLYFRHYQRKPEQTTA